MDEATVDDFMKDICTRYRVLIAVIAPCIVSINEGPEELALELLKKVYSEGPITGMYIT